MGQSRALEVAVRFGDGEPVAAVHPGRRDVFLARPRLAFDRVGGSHGSLDRPGGYVLDHGYGLQSIRTGLSKFFEGFGNRTVKAQTILSGMTQISDGLQQVSDGTKTGVDGAGTLGNVVEKTVNSQDMNVALYQAGVQRAKGYKAFVSAPSDATTKVLFLFNLPAIG